ncbi:MAG: YceH family protein [Dokdonella sp.]|uniref:YceH family protein n=1 Tax=Dokdonella sp. TaxID=2291710 RepID=UPI002CC745C4|nr:YceH family protein [Xanthomonadales bacterium]HQX65111.1 YceH family protein [Dokdonella sp.]HQY54790.1 YceH family protein [Dokdonella sp.]
MPIEENADGGEVAELHVLEAIEARILGSLIEKQATTPDAYPLTLNAVVAACNQKSSRDPISQYEPGEVGHALRQLEGKGLVSGTLSARASRYAHKFETGYHVTTRQRALLALLMLRGPQTLNELYSRSERLADFPDADEVRTVLERLASRAPALVVRLQRAAGQREDRYMHLLCGTVSPDTAMQLVDSPERPAPGLSERVSQLESLVAQLQEVIAELQARPGNGGPAADDGTGKA